MAKIDIFEVFHEEKLGETTQSQPLSNIVRTQNLQPSYYKIECKSSEQIKEMIHGILG